MTISAACTQSNPRRRRRLFSVVVDQGSLKAAQQQGIHWPWPRQMYAPIVDFCTLSGARAVAFDVLFTEPSSYGVEDDNLLADALKRNGHAFLPISLSREARSQARLGTKPAGATETAAGRPVGTA